MEKQIKSVGISVLLLLICSTILVISTYAYFTSEDRVINTINIGDVDIEVSEEFIPPSGWDGKEYKKVVQIKNNSKSPALIRVAIIPRWVDEQGNAWPGDTNIVKLNYETQNIIDTPSIETKDRWTSEIDSYHYYNTVIPKGSSTNVILNSVSANVPDNLKSRYEGKTLVIDVKAEAVQATKDAHRKTWSNIQEGSELQKMLDSLCSR
ncbi:MAG: BsaA family SipW-dependent biofilm matrix protein [Filifactoraceae bacterium]